MTMSTIGAIAEPSQRAPKPKPEKPDEAAYKANLLKAENEHAAAQNKVVRVPLVSSSFDIDYYICK